MPEVFPSLYLDEDVSVVLGAILCARGFKLLTARDASQLGRTDLEQLTVASAASRVLFTHNRVDFEQLHNQWVEIGKNHAGIIVARRRLPAELATRIGRLLTLLALNDFPGQIFHI